MIAEALECTSLQLPKIENPVLRYHGAKFRLADWVMQFFPPHLCYVESFGGAAGVLLQKPRAYAEVYNDLDGDIANFFTVLRDPHLREQLIEQIVLTPYARSEFELASVRDGDVIERARRVAVRAQMGFGSAGATKAYTGFRIDTKRRYGTAQEIWARYPDALAAAGTRLQGILVENRPAIEVILQHDAQSTLHFVDPPYLHRTRCRVRTAGYRHEMSDGDHAELLSALSKVSGFVVLSGYPDAMYDDALSGWTRHETRARISAGRGTALRTECVWLNPACQEALARGEGDLFP